MNINIVSPWSIRFDHILRRCTAELPWRVTQTPEPGCLNYFFPYHCYEATGGPTAVMFTHDMGHHNWIAAAHGTDVRLAWTTLYAKPLAEHGRTHRVVPGLDHAAFAPNGHVETRSVVGVVGIVYGDGRKGEDLWQRLVANNDQGWTLRAAGQGWAGDCKQVAYKDMPAFLRGLNVLLCPSRVEGVPYPPLEALACGVKVVIPRGVGVMDELPPRGTSGQATMPGIHHFEAGNYEDMRRAVGEALATAAEPEQLRAAVAGYTWDAWRESHMRAFEDWL